MLILFLMGADSRTKNERIHRRKLWDGKTTAEELYRTHAFPPDARCKCGSPKIAIRARSFMALKKLLAELPPLAMQIASQHEGRIPIVEMRGPGNVPIKYVRIGDAFACDLCKRDLEKACAKHPSDIIIHIDKGPEPDRPVIQVPKIILTDG